MKKITEHKGLNKLNSVLTLEATDDPAHGTHHHYVVFRTIGDLSGKVGEVHFHKGPFDETNPPNGMSNEVLICMVLDRLRDFQAGKLACRENAVALTKLEEALMWLEKRNKDRESRGVANTSNP